MNELANLVVADSAQQSCKKGWSSFKNNRFDEAETFFRESLSIERNADAYYGLAIVLNVKGDFSAAIDNLLHTIELNPSFGMAYGVLGDIYAVQGERLAAIENYARAIASDSLSNEYEYECKQRLVQIVRTLTFRKINDNLKAVLLECMDTPGIDLDDMGLSWLSIIEWDEDFSRVYRLSRHKEYHSFKVVFDSFPDYNAFLDPFFLTGLGRFIVPNANFERWATYLRRALLECISGEKNPFDEGAYEYLACALSRYCFLNNYIFGETKEEKKRITALKRKIGKQSEDEIKLSELAILGCYLPLYKLRKARKIASSLQGGAHVSQIPKFQIESHFERQKIKRKIQELTPIKNDISCLVRDQYEEYTAPIWETLLKNDIDPLLDEFLSGRQAKILVAGCSTGREALELGFCFPHAQILAIDLSRTSLAYAVQSAQDLDITNVTFKTADILELEDIDDNFDYIDSSRTLNHVSDCEQAANILQSLLKPCGLMKFSLYSRTSRKSIFEIREKIKEISIGSSAKEIRAFRSDAKKYLKYSTLKQLESHKDYYTMAGCRALLFPEYERSFDLIEVNNILDDLGLEFLQFSLPQDVIAEYVSNYPDDVRATNLQSWAKWEIRKPDAFAGMYRFFCRKNP